MARLLLVDDDEASALALARVLERAGFECDCAATGAAGVSAVRDRTPDLLLLDYDLPDMDAIEVLTEIGPEMPVIILTGARTSSGDEVLGLERGAADYVVKGTDRQVLVARIRNALRSGPAARRSVGPLRLDLRARRAYAHGEPLVLPPKQFAVLAALAERGGDLVTRDELLREVWGSDYRGYDHAVDQAVHALRQALPQPDWIETVRGVGYRLRPADADA